MTEWRVAPLREIADIRISNVDKKATLGEAPVRLCNYMDVYANDYIRADLPFMEATATRAEIQRFGVQQSDVMITKDSETPDDIGIPAVVMDQIEGLVCGYHLAQIRPNRALVDPVYLAKQLALPETAAYFAQRAAGSTRYGLSNRTIAEVPIRLAPLEQQQRIAEILARIDGAIERTEVLIDKHQQIKAGLMQDLFTRGVGLDGRLRPVNESVSTAFGRLPMQWRLGSILELTDPGRQPILTGPFGADLGSGDFLEEGVPVLRIGNVQAGHLALDDLLFVSHRKAQTLNRYRVKEGDLLFARQGATTGRNALADAQVEGNLINYHIIRVALGHDRCAPLFVEAAFASEVVKRQIERDKGRGTREGINTAQITSLAFPIAEVEEQRRIASILSSQNERINADQDVLRSLRMRKQGLMQDLLTGKVRMPVASATAAHA
jgi:type I restriction enzyme S subunit